MNYLQNTVLNYKQKTINISYHCTYITLFNTILPSTEILLFIFDTNINSGQSFTNLIYKYVLMGGCFYPFKYQYKYVYIKFPQFFLTEYF